MSAPTRRFWLDGAGADSRIVPADEATRAWVLLRTSACLDVAVDMCRTPGGPPGEVAEAWREALARRFPGERFAVAPLSSAGDEEANEASYQLDMASPEWEPVISLERRPQRDASGKVVGFQGRVTERGERRPTLVNLVPGDKLTLRYEVKPVPGGAAAFSGSLDDGALEELKRTHGTEAEARLMGRVLDGSVTTTPSDPGPPPDLRRQAADAVALLDPAPPARPDKLGDAAALTDPATRRRPSSSTARSASSSRTSTASGPSAAASGRSSSDG